MFCEPAGWVGLAWGCPASVVSWGSVGPERVHLWPGQRRALAPRSGVQQASSDFSTGGFRLSEDPERAGLCPCHVCCGSVARTSQALLRCHWVDGEPLLCRGSCGHTAVGVAGMEGAAVGGVEGQISQDATCLFPDWGSTSEPSPGRGREGSVGRPLCGCPGRGTLSGLGAWGGALRQQEGWWAPGTGWGSCDGPSLGGCGDSGGGRVVAVDLPGQESG